MVDIAPGNQLVVSTDTLISDRHFPAQAKGDAVGYRSMAVAASDLAAMGARPLCATVALTIEKMDADWTKAFAAGIATASRAFAMPIVGGNIARGPHSVTVTVHGQVPAQGALLRSGARQGDGVFVTGTLGGAALALAQGGLERYSLADLTPGSAPQRYWQPAPRFEVAMALAGVATAAIDLSDGLSSDLAHVARASGLAAVVDTEHIPTFPGIDPVDAATAGDDYELVFSASPRKAYELGEIPKLTGVPVARIGWLRPGEPGRIHWREHARPVAVGTGYRHF